ncbi:MAG: TMEM165/GDT1 family protein [Chitinophagaceae bacterium]|nr:TMEM165/GDT1 family protein [Oligoflexus sp.]
MEAIFNSFLIVALGEMGDKTQLLAFVLATRFKKPWAVLAGIFVATVANHLLAATAGQWISAHLPPQYLKIGLAVTFFAFAIWILVPDKIDDDVKTYKFGAFLTTVVVFFLAEMGDKTQLATVALAARFQSVVLVTVGTTVGMMLTDGLAVFFGEKVAARISMTWMHRIAAVLFVICGVLALTSMPSS